MANSKNFNYQQLSEELENIIDQLQSGDIGVDEALVVYERGLVIARQLQDYLNNAENKITELKSKYLSAES